MKANLPSKHSNPGSDPKPGQGQDFAAAVLDAAPADRASAQPTGAASCAQPPSTKRSGRARRVRPGWKPTLVRESSFQQLRAIQKSSCDCALDLSCLSDACIALALELGAERIVERALAILRADLRNRQSASASSPLSGPSSQTVLE